MLKRPHNVLALDLAGVTGWAYGLPDDTPTAGAAAISAEDDGRSYKALAALIRSLLKEAPITAVAIEAPIHMVGRTTFKTGMRLQGYNAIAKLVAAEARLPVVDAPVNSVRVAFIGKAPKKDVAKELILAECRRCGVAVKDHNAADAVAIWFWAQKIHWASSNVIKIDRQRTLV